MAFSLACARIAAAHLDIVLLIGTVIMALHVVMEFKQMQAG
ncbi:MAG: hypothetical protein VKI81_05905 [Synechococcaceae cyanobacterium]|nr:hypothetical protein [Synechococcaceae cyanobacterium]